MTVLVSFLGWAFTAQLTRYLLPVLALAAALVGIGVVNALSATPFRTPRLLTLIVSAGVIAGLAAAPLLLLPKWTAQVPIDLITGKQTSAEFVEETVAAAEALQTASTLLPPDTRVGYFATWEGAQLYTEARLIYPESGVWTREGSSIDLDLLGTTPEGGPGQPAAGAWTSTTPSGTALRAAPRIGTPPCSPPPSCDTTRILAGDRSGYLFRLLPPGGRRLAGPADRTCWPIPAGERRCRQSLDHGGPCARAPGTGLARWNTAW